MKSLKWVLASVVLCMSLSAFSQTDSAKKDSVSRRDTTTQRKDTASASMQSNSATNNAGQSSTSSTMNQPQAGSNQSQATTTGKQTFPKPNFGRYYIPVLGSYQSQPASTSTSDQGKTVTVSADETNAGKIWIEGLTPVKFYALLKTSPGTYKIPAQKQDEKSIQEGTVSYDDASKQINICLGCGFQADQMSDMSAANETAIPEASAKSKNSKTKAKAKTVISFSGVKSAEQTASIR